MMLRLALISLVVAALSVPKQTEAQLPGQYCSDWNPSACIAVGPFFSYFLPHLSPDQLDNTYHFSSFLQGYDWHTPFLASWHDYTPTDHFIKHDGGSVQHSVPEPATWILLATGLLGMAFVARPRRKDDELA